MSIHESVLLKEAIESLKIVPGMTVVDATLGGGGHSREILKEIMPGGKLIAIDQDPDAISAFRKSFKSELEKENVFLVEDNFSRLKEILDSLKIKKIGAVLADLGISSDQLDETERGFSFSDNGPLDMRMNPAGEVDAMAVINKYPEEKIENILKKFGDERYARRIARAIVWQRKIRDIRTTQELVDVIAKSVPEKYRHHKLHFATKTFQALRIEVNKEIENLERFLEQAVGVLNPGGRMAVISFHSGEDRIVKNFFRQNARGCICPKEFPVCRCNHKSKLKIITGKPIVPADREQKNNPRSRSAKMRVAEKI